MRNAMTRYCMVAVMYVLGSITCAAQHVNGEATYLSFSVPGAQGTYPMSINASMVVAGYYYVSPLQTRGFVRDADGTITTFDVKGAIWTEPESINAAGEITGFYEMKAGVAQGFLRYADGSVTTFVPPGEQKLNPAQAQPMSINEFGEIAGNYPFPNVASSVFTRSTGGIFTTISAGRGAAYKTVATFMNSSGAVVGYFDSIPGEHGFLAHPDGYWDEIVVPLTQVAQARYCSTFTVPEAVNAGGTIAGWYLYYTDPCQTAITGGFVVSPQGIISSFTLPGTLPTLPLPGFSTEGESLTVPRWISLDDAGDIAGSYTDDAGVQHGFVRNPYGTITTFDPPEGKQTTSTGINNGGAVTGYYQYKAGAGPPVGFIRVPLS
jgi:hypothetical protein